MSVVDVARIMLGLDMLEQYAKTGYWLVGIVGWCVGITMCFYIIRACKIYIEASGG